MESKPQPQRVSRKTKRFHVALLFDVEHTLLDIDRVATDLRRHLEQEVGLTCQQQYGTIVEHLRTELGYADSLAPSSGIGSTMSTITTCFRSRRAG